MKVFSSVASKITAEVLRDGEVIRSQTFSNIMTDYGLQSWASGNLGSHLALGSGSRAEAGNITSLAAYARSQSGSYSYSESNVIDQVAGVMRSNHTLAVTFPIETANQNYSEMGIHNNSINQLQTYALIRDALGQPTSIGVLSGEQLRAYYTVQFSLPLSRTDIKDVSGVQTTITTVPLYTGQSISARLPQVADSRLWAAGQGIPTAGLPPAGGVAAPNGVWFGGEYRLNLGTGDGNLTGGIALVRAGGSAPQIAVMMHFDPPLDKKSGFTAQITAPIVLVNGVYHES